MTGSIAVSQCGHTPNRTGHHGTVVASTVGTVAISCNAGSTVQGVPIESSTTTAFDFLHAPPPSPKTICHASCTGQVCRPIPPAEYILPAIINSRKHL